MPKLTMRLSEGGGHLITRHSADEVGPRNYVVKRDWRREGTDEVIREGDTPFASHVTSGSTTINLSTALSPLSVASGTKVNCGPRVGGGDYTVSWTDLQYQASRYGWWVLLEKSGPESYLVKVYDYSGAVVGTLTNQGDKMLMLATPDGIVNVYAITLGEDPNLIFTARRDDGKTALIVGTATTLYRYFAHEDYRIYESGVYVDNAAAATVPVGAIAGGTWLTIGSGFSSVSTARRWEARNVAGEVVFNNGVDLPVVYSLDEFAVTPLYELREQGVAYVGTIEEIEGILVCGDIGVIHPDYLSTVMNAVGYGLFGPGQELNIDRVHYRVLWGDPAGVRRWGASVPGSMIAGGRALTVQYPVSSISAGDAVRVVGAGVNGADLVTTLLYKTTALSWVLADKASITVNNEAVSRSDAATLISGRYDLLDIASPILRLKKFQDKIVVAKSTGFVVGEYTGEAGLPFVFQTVYAKDEEENCLHWRNTLIDVRGEYLLYASETEFYRFDLITRRPQIHPVMRLCSNLFFTAVAGQSQETVYAAANTFTKEAWFVFPGATDKAIALYYGEGADVERCSTVGTAYSAMGIVSRPVDAVVHGSEEKMLVAGIAGGTLVQYGHDRTGPLVYKRRGSVYVSQLNPGYADFGDASNEKHISQYLLLLSSLSPNTALSVDFFGVRNPSETMTAVVAAPVALSSPATRNTIPLHTVLHLVQERIACSAGANVRLALRQWVYGRIGSQNFVRR